MFKVKFAKFAKIAEFIVNLKTNLRQTTNSKKNKIISETYLFELHETIQIY